MSHTIRGFQADKALDLADAILDRTGESEGVLRIESVLKEHGVVSDYTYWKQLPNVLADLGYEYDEIMEVIP